MVPMNFNLETMQILDRSPRFNLFSSQDHAIVKQAMSRLDGREKCVVLLRFWEGNTVSQIAEILDIPLQEVICYLSRALKKLKPACLGNPEFSRSNPASTKPKNPANILKNAA